MSCTEVEKFNDRHLKYYTFSPKPFNNSAPKEVVQKVFRHWSDFWTDQYSSYKSEQQLNPMDFYRQDIFTFVTYKDTIVGTNSLTFFDLSFDLSGYPYLNFMYPEDVLEKLSRKGVQTIMTLQYFMVDPEFRYKKTGINLPSIIGALSLKNMELHKIDGTLTAARTDVGAAKVAKHCGFEQISKEKLVHNVPVAPMFCSKPKIYPDSKEDIIINRLWTNKTSYTNKGELNENKHAA